MRGEITSAPVSSARVLVALKAETQSVAGNPSHQCVPEELFLWFCSSESFIKATWKKSPPRLTYGIAKSQNQALSSLREKQQKHSSLNIS